MKRVALAAIALLAFLYPHKAHADSSDYSMKIAYDTATLHSISVTTNVALALSTGTNILLNGASAQPFTIARGTAGITPTPGDLMRQRRQLEFFNDTGQDVWFSPNVNVSSFTGDATRTYGRRLPHGASWSTDSLISSYYVVAGSTTRKAFEIIQQR